MIKVCYDATLCLLGLEVIDGVLTRWLTTHSSDVIIQMVGSPLYRRTQRSRQNPSKVGTVVSCLLVHALLPIRLAYLDAKLY